MSAWANQPYPDLNYDYNLPKEIKQIDRRIVKMLNEYFGILKVSCGTINVNTLHKMCLLKLLRDVIDSDGPLYVFMQQSEAKDWTDYIKRCFNELVYKDGAMDIDPEENVCPPAPEPTPPGPEPTDKYIVSINATPSTTEFYINTPFVFSGVVEGTYNDGSTRVLSSSEYTCSTPDMSRLGQQLVTVTYNLDPTISDDYTITVLDTFIERIAITTPAVKTTFQVGEDFIFGGTVTGYYNTGIGSKNVTSSVQFEGNSTATEGEKWVIIHYTNEKQQDLTTSYKITVIPRPTLRVPEELILVNPKSNFTQGEPWEYPKDNTSQILVRYNDGSSPTPVSLVDCSFTYNGTPVTNNITANTGGKEITVSYTENSVTVKKKYSITVTENVVVPTHWYLGVSHSIPGASTVKAGTAVPLTTLSYTSPLLNDLVFWVATPPGKHLVQATNIYFDGDIVLESNFDSNNSVDIDGISYTLYTATYPMPANIQFNVLIA